MEETEKREHVERLLQKAVAVGLDGVEWASSLGFATVCREYNGIGPEWAGAALRAKTTEILSLFEPAALIHDLRNYKSDGSRFGFNFANFEFLGNCLKLANAAYPWWSWRRYRARAVAHLLYDFVQGPGGWTAWADCHARNLSHETPDIGLRSPMSDVGSTETTKGKTTMHNERRFTLMQIAAALLAVGCVLSGCSVTKINYEKDENGVVSYRIYRNSHWLKMEGEGMRGGMTGDGKFEFDLEGMKSSPSEEFNRTMQTYTSAFAELAQIAAAAYNPSSRGTLATATPVAATVAPATNAVEAAEAK